MTDLDHTLKHGFGLSSFRPWQREAIEALLEGGRVLVVAPTGGGKSLCYQLPAAVLGGTTVVVSPLIALMEDQVRSLTERGIPATYLASTLTPEQRRERERRIFAGEYRLVYVAPERLRSGWLVDRLAKLRPPLVAIDEAHCISQWGHDFRPDYLRLGEVLHTLQPARVLACTATATPSVRDEIVQRLGLPGDRTKVVLRGFARPNLHLAVEEIDGLGARRKLALSKVRAVLGGPAAPTGGAIIYAGTRRNTEKVAGDFQDAGWRCAAYHAGLEPARREAVNAQFAAGELDVVVATNAFGMGIDRADIRIVIHVQAPGTVEHYYQEVGRAGRDGQPAWGLLLSGVADFGLRKRLIDLGRPEGEHDESADAWAARQWGMFLDLMRYVEAGSCRHDTILRYFGDDQETLGGCGHCDVCERLGDRDGPDPVTDEDAIVVRKALSGVARAKRRAGLRAIANSLRGQDSQRLRQLRLTELSTHGILSDRKENWILALLRRLMTAGLVDVTSTDYPVPFITREGVAVMKGERPVRVLLPPTSVGKRRSPRSKREPEALPADFDGALFDRLKDARRDEAQKRGVPAYVVCHDRTLREVAAAKPRSVEQLAGVHGMGPARIESFGARLLEVVAQA
jgi:ATP-dependent DNA helicase RecQ